MASQWIDTSPFREPTSRSLTVCVQCQHWACTSTELPCGEGRTNCLCTMVLEESSCYEADPQSVDSWCHFHFLWVLWSSLSSGGQGTFNSKLAGVVCQLSLWKVALSHLPGRCVNAGHLQCCRMVHALNVFEVQWPWYVSHSRLFCYLVLVHIRQGFVSLVAWASRSHSIFVTARVPEG